MQFNAANIWQVFRDTHIDFGLCTDAEPIRLLTRISLIVSTFSKTFNTSCSTTSSVCVKKSTRANRYTASTTSARRCRPPGEISSTCKQPTKSHRADRQVHKILSMFATDSSRIYGTCDNLLLIFLPSMFDLSCIHNLVKKVMEISKHNYYTRLIIFRPSVCRQVTWCRVVRSSAGSQSSDVLTKSRAKYSSLSACGKYTEMKSAA